MFEYVGSCRLFLGNPVIAAGAGMKNLGYLEDVTFNAGVRMAFTSNANLAGAPNAAGIHTLTPLPVAQAQLKDAQLAILKELILGHVFDTDVLGGGDSFQLIAAGDVPTLCILPDAQAADGASAANAIWLPAAIPDGLDGFRFSRPQAGEIGNPYNVQFMGAYRAADQGDPDADPTPVAATAIPVGNRMWFMGPPDTLGLSWSLPAIS